MNFHKIYFKCISSRTGGSKVTTTKQKGFTKNNGKQKNPARRRLLSEFFVMALIVYEKIQGKLGNSRKMYGKTLHRKMSVNFPRVKVSFPFITMLCRCQRSSVSFRTCRTTLVHRKIFKFIDRISLTNYRMQNTSFRILQNSFQHIRNISKNKSIVQY